MAEPVLSASFDKASYAKGDPILLTVDYSDPDQEALVITVAVTDASGNTTGPVSVSALIDPLVVEVADNSGRTWTKVADSGSTAVYRSVA